MTEPGSTLLDLASAFSATPTVADWPHSVVIRFRDLLLYRTGPLITVIACDSNAGIGDLPADIVRQSSRTTGYSATKVPMMEVLAAGAEPFIVVNNLGTSLAGTGSEVLAGIRDCIANSGYSPVITGSDETNVLTAQSSVGVTVIGIATPDRLRLARARDQDAVLLIGIPQDGITLPYDESDPALPTPADIVDLLGIAGVHEVLPIGSRGARYEASELARTADLTFTESDTADVDLTTSAGSSTALIVACSPDIVEHLIQRNRFPTTYIGALAGDR